MGISFDEGKTRVFDFMKSVSDTEEMKSREDQFKNSVHYKKAMMNRCQDEARNVCLDAVFAKLYRDAVPLSGDYKAAQCDDMDYDCKQFFAKQAPKGMEYYIRGAADCGNVVAKKLINGVDKIVQEEYMDKAFHPENYSPEDMEFKLTDDVENKLDVLSKNLEFEDLSSVIHDNVRKSAASEISRAKDEKERNKQLEADLANDLSITSESAVDDRLSIINAKKAKIYSPSLFEGMMIGYLNKYHTESAQGNTIEVHPYQSMEMYVSEGTSVDTMEPAMVYAFMESVKEMTKVNILKALKLDTRLNSKKYVTDLASEYASM